MNKTSHYYYWWLVPEQDRLLTGTVKQTQQGAVLKQNEPIQGQSGPKLTTMPFTTTILKNLSSV